MVPNSKGFDRSGADKGVDLVPTGVQRFRYINDIELKTSYFTPSPFPFLALYQ